MAGGSKKKKTAEERPVIKAPRGTIKPHRDFDEEAAVGQAKKLHRALQKPHDIPAAIRILTKYTLEERKYLEDVYNAQYSPALQAALRQATGGDLRATLLALLTWQNQYLAGWARSAMKGPGTRERTLVELFCGRQQHEIADVVKTYSRLHGHSLESELRSELSGQFLQLCLTLTDLTQQRDEEEPVTEQHARQLAERLHTAGETQRGAGTAPEFISIFCGTSYPLLQKAFDVYPKVSAKGASIENVVKAAFRGDMRTGMLTMTQCIRDQPAYFAGVLYRAMKGLGTDDGTLIRVLVSRSEIDLENVKESYRHLYGKSLAAAVADDTSGDYRSCLLAIIKSWT